MKQDITVFGALEPIYIDDWGLMVVGKIDTGAYSGALHAENIHIDTQDGIETLVFRPISADTPEVRTTRFTVSRVTSAFGQQVQRYVIPITLTIRGEVYQTVIGLSNRQEMRFPIIIGRRLLEDNTIMVDVTQNNHLRPPKGAK